MEFFFLFWVPLSWMDPQVQGSSCCCSLLCTIVLFFMLLLLKCCYLLKDLILLCCIPSCRSWESSRVNSLCFYSSKFFFLLFVFIVFPCFFVLLFYLFCGAWLVMKYFENKCKPFEKYFWQFCIFAYLFYIILSLFAYKCFGSF
jgi:hypothetical protein